jgi:hypothetical protein
MKPRKLIKGLALSFTLGAILSVGTDPAITQQVPAIAMAKAGFVGNQVEKWVREGASALLKQIVNYGKSGN